mmetsp:Transcript_86/g.182  ORF Transcript_86/g.182 Transcript_86/m.182 type:complete len:161 (-) Transcript_86:347-829(-)
MLGFLGLFKCACAPKKTASEGIAPPEPASCPLCLMYEVYYRNEQEQPFCQDCGSPCEQGLLCPACSNSKASCYNCGIRFDPEQGAEQWSSVIERVVERELHNLGDVQPDATIEEREFHSHLQGEWQVFRRVWKELLDNNPPPLDIMFMRQEYEERRCRYQ